jgi:excisionase family DNA binding protein
MKGVERMFTTNEVAEMLDVTPARVRQMILAGEMLAEKKGRDLLIAESQIEKAKGRKTTPGRPAKTSKKAGK